MSLHKRTFPQQEALTESLKSHGLEHDTPSQLADTFRLGWQAFAALSAAQTKADERGSAQPVAVFEKQGLRSHVDVRNAQKVLPDGRHDLYTHPHPDSTQPETEPVAWESMTEWYVKYISERRYQLFSPKVRAWYKPYRCSNCHPDSAQARDDKPPIGAESMARSFHEAYERLAPKFHYATRPASRTFDPESSNGQLMIAVCEELTAAMSARPQGGET